MVAWDCSGSSLPCLWDRVIKEHHLPTKGCFRADFSHRGSTAELKEQFIQTPEPITGGVSYVLLPEEQPAPQSPRRTAESGDA